MPRATRYDGRVSVHSAGDVVHGYRIVRTLGRGGLGTTFEATREGTGEANAGAAMGIQECDQLIVRWSTCDPPRLGWTLDGMKKQDAWTDAQSKASAQRFCKAQLENFPEEACHYKK